MKIRQKRIELVTRPVKVQYKGTPIIERYQQPPGYENVTTFFYNFAIPQKELVSEEYLIYDVTATYDWCHLRNIGILHWFLLQ